MKMELLNLTLCIIEYAAIYTFLQILLKPRFKSIIPTVLIAILNSTLIYFASDTNIILRSILCILYLMIGNIILYKDKWYIKSAFSILLIYSLYIIDIISGNIFSVALDRQFLEVFNSDFTYRLIICSIIKIFNILIIVSIYHSFAKVNFELNSKIWLMFNIVMGVFLAVSVAFIDIYSKAEQNDITTVIYLIISAAFLAMSMIVVYFFTYICSSFQQKQRLYALQTYYHTIEEKLMVQTLNSEKLQKIRHDIKNHLITVKTLLASNDIQKANALLSEAIGQTDDISINIDKSTGNSIIDAAIAYKSAICKNKGITFEYDLNMLPPLRIDDIDISSIISNMLDNAIEASEHMNNPCVKIKIKMHRSYLSVTVINKYDTSVLVNNQGRLLSSKSNSSEHGYGIQIIKEIAAKYDGDSTWKLNNGIFQINVILKNT